MQHERQTIPDPVPVHLYKAGRKARIPLSCDPCRSRKCVAQRPRLAMNGRAASIEALETHTAPIAHDQNNHEDLMQHRIEHLEDLVKRIIAQGQIGLPTNINKLKQTWSQSQDDQTNHGPLSYTEADGSSLLFGQVKQIERAEVLATLPSKLEVDELIRQFFDYTTFPLSVPRLLFSILGIVMLSYHQWEEPPEYEGVSESLFQLYRLRTVQCLLIGDIAKCLPYTIETLRFNATAELNRQDDNSRNLWIVAGVIVRAAINMGYHRDPSQLTSLSVLQAEYRRRVWNAVMQMDDLASFLAGFPCMMGNIYSDTREPRNIHDWELSEETTVLPPSRPLSECTPVTYIIVKGCIAHAVGRITDFNNLPGEGSYDTVLNIDKSLCEAYQNMPSHMKVFQGKRDLSSLNRQSGISGVQLESLYHKGICTLQKFIAKARLDPQYKLSRERCLSSALAILDYQHLLDSSWYKFSGVRQMLAFAAMILFLELEHGRKGPDLKPPYDCAVLLHALETSCALWSNAKGSCEQAHAVYQILSGILSSFQTSTGSSYSQKTNGSPDSTFEMSGQSSHFQPLDRGMSMEKDMFRMLNGEMDIDWVGVSRLYVRKYLYTNPGTGYMGCVHRKSKF
ncbi:conserved hypothetical protein [Talaromyces stipitatus ATCC 10500]|uniref:Xylanolytic transcriptional activator regulatory domain-containing protein n=1 Tax=Talaromyces stipitatus (strain ATCC 10500 / CBS 375.48 / QM 6759 / NRRL 1006) TaxID=441959 RepID=B8MP64_TALSN|nr:uncharacterized protein TSTA_105150 [Talaromyces stipitatus ATCC 10500]EED14303.1 conserved hypothetical protein [Talaromyces stipitatus ATCC 10500]